MSATSAQEIWFLTGSQELYGQETLDQVGVEHVRIGHGTDLRALKNELRWNDAAFVRAR